MIMHTDENEIISEHKGEFSLGYPAKQSGLSVWCSTFSEFQSDNSMFYGRALILRGPSVVVRGPSPMVRCSGVIA